MRAELCTDLHYECERVDMGFRRRINESKREYECDEDVVIPSGVVFISP